MNIEAEVRAFLFKDMDGCGDHGCIIDKPKGMGTNGGCRCHENRATNRIVWNRIGMLRKLGDSS